MNKMLPLITTLCEVDRPNSGCPLALRVVNLALLLLGMVGWIWMPVDGAGRELPVCKYSVRDVAFVNVHGKSWQLKLQKPYQVDETTMIRWSGLLRKKLERSNVGFEWVETLDGEAPMTEGTDTSQPVLPAMVISSSESGAIAVRSTAGHSLEQVLDRLLDSQKRSVILEQVVDSLCVFVLFETGIEAIDREARAECEAAVEQVAGQMWTLEKPTERGPTLVTVSRTESVEELWLRHSLGVTSSEQPAVAIVYGQGRRLGELLVGDEIVASKLVGRAGICGTDCECDLDRQWLYGTQMIHDWSKEQELAAEASLSFDPHSAFVVAEVAQIVRKNSRRGAGRSSTRDRVDLGGGLVIHELDSITLSNDPESAKEPRDELEDKLPLTEPLPKTGDNATATPHKPTGESEPATDAGGQRISLPWPLLVGLAVAVLAVFLITIRRGPR